MIVVGIVGLVHFACGTYGAEDETASPPATTSPPDDAGGADEASTTDDAGDGSDALESPPCSEQLVLLGSKEVSTAPDADTSVHSSSVDAFRYEAAPEATGRTARCAWVYAAETRHLSDGTVYFGVYTDEGDSPKTLLRKVTIRETRVGWNTAAIDPPLPLAPGQRLWLAVIASDGNFRIRAPEAPCAPGQAVRHIQRVSPHGTLPETFAAESQGEQCGAALYLGP